MPIIKAPDGRLVRFPDEMPKEEIRGILANKFPEEFKSLSPKTDYTEQAYINAPEAQKKAGVYGRSVVGGIADAFDMIPQVSQHIASKIMGEQPLTPEEEQLSMFHPVGKTIRELIDKASFNTLKPNDTTDRFIDTFGNFLGGTKAISKMANLPTSSRELPVIAGSAGIYQGLTEADAPEWAKLAGTLLGGYGISKGLPQVASTAIKEVTSVPNAPTSISEAVKPVREQFSQEGRKVAQNYGNAKISGRGTILDTEQTLKPMIRNIKNSLEEQGAYLNIEGSAVPSKYMDALETYSKVGAIPVNKLGRMRQNITRSAYDETNPNAKAALKVIKTEFDNAFKSIGEEAILSGSPEAVSAWQNSAKEYAQYAKKYGTNADVGQTKMFENIVKKNQLDNEQLANAILGTSIGKADSGQTIQRMFDVAGNQAPVVKDNIKKGLLVRLLKAGEGEQPGTYNIMKMKKQTQNMLDKNPTMVKKLFTPSEIKSLQSFASSPAEGSIRRFAKYMATYSPIGQDSIIQSLSKNPIKGKKQTLMQMFKGDTLKGSPVNYTPLVGAPNTSLREKVVDENK